MFIRFLKQQLNFLKYPHLDLFPQMIHYLNPRKFFSKIHPIFKGNSFINLKNYYYFIFFYHIRYFFQVNMFGKYR